MYPTIHMNGTNGSDLLKETLDAIEALRVARAKVAAITIHGRDYYVQAGNHTSLDAAREQRYQMLANIHTTITQLEERAIAISDQLR